MKQLWIGGLLVVLVAVLLVDAKKERRASRARSHAHSMSNEPFRVEIIAPPVKKKKRCASGCSLKKHPVPPFTERDFVATLRRFAGEALPGPGAKEGSPALEKLLFYGRRTKELIRLIGLKPLDQSHRQFLQKQLRYDHAIVGLRIVDERGRVRALLANKRVPFGIKQHLHPVVRDVQAMDFNGTVMRTGLGHIWARY
jgi:hypothetical protein